MRLDGIWLASASKRRAILLEDLISEKPRIKLVCSPLIEDEISPKKPTLKETVFSITKMKMENAFLEISLGRLEELDFRGDSVDISKIVTIVSDTLVEDPDSFEQVFGKPSDILEAASMLKRLSGRKHKVWSSTGFIIHRSLNFNHIPDFEFENWLGYIWTDFSTVEIDDLSEEILFELLNSNSWEGKAGAYDLDGKMSKYARVKDGEKITVLGLSSTAMNKLVNLF
tara:strand:+ start:269 stop:949 length:681 start_codon:yes stop_codon:yes gene_type:complete